MRETCAGCIGFAASDTKLSEGDAQAALERPVLIHLHRLVALGRSDLAESGVAERSIGQIEPRRVREVVRLGAEFQLQPFGDVELAENRTIDVEQVRAM